jgi:hypothetical protein
MKIRYFIPIIVTSIISGILFYSAFINFLPLVLDFSENLLLGGIKILSPILIAILLSYFSGYLFASANRSDKYPFGVIFLLSASITFVVVYSCEFYRLQFICEGSRCGTGTEPLIVSVILCLPTAIMSPLIGFCTVWFYKLGMKLRYNQNEGTG